MKILITGATGFIGSYLTGDLLRAGWEVLGLARSLSRGTLSSVMDERNFRFVQADLQSGIPIQEEMDVIIHAAAKSPEGGNGRDEEDQVPIEDYVNSNVIGFQNLIRYALGAKVKKLIYLSSVSIYGDVQSDLIDEDSPIHNPSGYGISKVIGEMILRQNESRIDSVALRLPGVIGRGAYTAWPAKILKRILENREIGIYNPDALFNNMVHLSDLSVLIQGIIKGSHSGFEPLTLGCLEPMAIRQIVDSLIRQFETTSQIRRYHLDRRSFTISIDKARRLFGFRPMTTREILEKYMSEIKEEIHSRDEPLSAISYGE